MTKAKQPEIMTEAELEKAAWAEYEKWLDGYIAHYTAAIRASLQQDGGDEQSRPVAKQSPRRGKRRGLR